MVVLETKGNRVEIDPEVGGRLASLRIAGLEILVPRAKDLLAWGSYPMAPWISRIRAGRFTFAGREIALPLRMPPHAIHGTVLGAPWQIVRSGETSCVLETPLGESWPWPGTARQSFSLSPTGLQSQLEVHSESEAFPASVGWHPWSLRRLDRGDAVELDFGATSIYLTDEEGMPTGEIATPGPGPFDDKFTGVYADPVLRWPFALKS
jgi:aldose 1-epimerase